MPTKGYSKDGLSKILLEYCDHQKEIQSVLDCTVYQRLIHVKPFVNALGTNGVPSKIKNVDSKFIHSYVLKTAPQFSRKYQKEFLCSLRSFFKFLTFKGYTDKNLLDAVPKIPTWQLSEVPRGIKWDDVQKLLAMPRMSTQNGRRNYAVLLIMATYGVRFAQASRLKLKDIYWKQERIYFASCKFGRPLSFPLYENVAIAVLDYIKNGRPQSNLPDLFLQRGNPPERLSHGFHSTLKLYFKRAGIESSTRGFHTIRHAFATKLMNEDTPLKNISDLLGHTSIKSTLCYTKVDEKRLRYFCREWPEVNL